MIQGIGTDIIEVSRIRSVMEKDIGFRDKIFTPGEISYCETKKHKYDEYGKPMIRLYGKADEFARMQGITKIHVTLSHLKETATATVTVE